MAMPAFGTLNQQPRPMPRYAVPITAGSQAATAGSSTPGHA